MTIKQVHQKAIKAGYDHYLMSDGKKGLKVIGECRSDVLLDPLFWQALGKAMGWDDIVHIGQKGNVLKIINNGHHCEGLCRNGWKWHWHQFISHLAEGKDAESFFKELK